MNNAFVLAGAEAEQHVPIVAKGRHVTVTRDDTFNVVRVGDKAVISCADGDIVVSSYAAATRFATAAMRAMTSLL